jgi:alpha-2-macroglobulin
MSAPLFTGLSRRPGLALIGAAVLLALSLGVQAQSAARGGPLPTGPLPLQNHDEPFVGEPFFLLSDATYGSTQTALVRLEVNSPQMLEQAGGVDLRVYRIPEPLHFLQQQKNLHRVQVEGRPAQPGLANTLTHLWDSWVVKSRLAWRQLFSGDARLAVTRQAPALKTPATLTRPSTFEEPAQYRPVPGLTVVERFRYPVQAAKPIQPPKGLALAGSSSEFIKPSAGNIMVPVGKRAPGLYLVEALAGSYRATTLLFVSDSVALTKVSGEQMLVWTAQRDSGAPVARSEVVWTDGVGVLKSGQTDARGLVSLDRRSPEQTYVFGRDPAGGVFISENFYYDSEIYAAKVYAVTDRPLYRPGDTVQVKVTGREFRSARSSVALPDAAMGLSLADPSGQLLLQQQLRFVSGQGADTRFALPENAPAGGYELRLAMGDDVYTAAFRVADYQKPHFEITLRADKTDWVVGDKVSGTLQLNYPDGKPVAQARISLSARSQQLTMVEGELDYGGPFPLKLSQEELVTDSSGVAKFSLPAAQQPSRYLLTALATDGAAYRVRVSKELLVERGGAAWRLSADRQFSAPGQAVHFSLVASQRDALQTGNTGAATTAPAAPARWEWLRLEDRSTGSGKVVAGQAIQFSFAQPGSYTLQLRDAQGRIVGGASHWVSGEGLKAPAGSVGMVFDKPLYQVGETARVLLSFPEPVDHALLSLERDRVEATALLGASADWVRSERLGPTQWQVWLPVREDMSPNMTLSVAYVKDGDYVFQNAGVLVEQARVALAFRTDKPVYAPGELVQVTVSTALAGKPVAAEVTVSVVDEMIYVLQPDIAPSIDEFFFHPRRNNVRTSASLSFIGYDLATSQLGVLPSSRQVNQRAVKVLERPRRDNIDTAAWEPRLRTDASGQVSFSFRMPDSLTRWRLTGRAMDAQGTVGQQVAWLRSDKPFYAKWTSPDWQRVGDQAQASIALFNQTGAEAKLEWEATGPGVAKKDSLSVRPGINFVSLPLLASAPGAVPLKLLLRQDGKLVDQLELPLQRLPVAWRGPRQQLLDLRNGPATLALPGDASRVALSFSADPASAAMSRWMDELIDYPYGCVEQTASRLLPLSMALQSLAPAQQTLAPELTQRLATARLALAQMAGPQARFGWWGRDMTADPFLTVYAYYADWRASRALGMRLPDEHWARLLDVMGTDGPSLLPLQRALALSWMQEMGLPVGSMVLALAEQLAQPATLAAKPQAKRGSWLMTGAATPETRDMALVLLAHLAKAQAGAAVKKGADEAAGRLAGLDHPLVQALLMASGRASPAAASGWLARVHGDVPTMDKAQTLLWLRRALGGSAAVASAADGPSLPLPWQRSVSLSGQTVWHWPAGLALPSQFSLPAGATAGAAWLSFESAQAPTASLPLRIERSLWRVVPQAKASSAQAASGVQGLDSSADNGRLKIKLEAVAPGTPLSSDALYLDQLSVSSPQALRWGVLDVALPPGAAVEGSTWGLDLDTAGQTQALERARHQATAQGYAVPLEALKAGEPLVLRHLLRFSQRGSFKLPPSRVMKMYDPEAQALDSSGRWATVEVR